MAWDESGESSAMRVRIMIAAVAAALLFLGGALWRIQVLGARLYMSSLEQQSMRRVRLPGARGRILDRNGVCLADNRPCYCVAVYVEELRRPGGWQNTVDAVEKVVASAAEVLGLKVEISRGDIERHVSKRLALPFIAWRDIDEKAISRWAESGADLPGVDIAIEPVRVYPRGSLAAHALGYVGKADPKQDLEEPYHFYLPEMEGARGVEAVMNHVLTGIPGGRLLRVDASGFKHERVGERPPEAGRDVTLALDTRIQTLVEQNLAGVEGAAVILDPSNGDVLALASSPTFDPNVFSPGVARATWRGLVADKSQPLVNRAVAEMYPPGSTFKMIVVLAAVSSGRAGPETVFDCPGYFALGSTRFRCWRPGGHGQIAMVEALEQSCNSYFCQLGLRCGHERIVEMAGAMGLGRRTGIELASEVDGILPGDRWKRERFRDAWRPGDTCNLSIGQGFLAATPLQMAVGTAAIGNGGRVYRPRLVLRGDSPAGETVNVLKCSAEALRTARQGMYEVVNAPRGTGKRARVDGLAMAAKTGTAEFGPRDRRRKHTWMLAFAPFEHPRVALAMVVEEGESGGLTVAPRVRRIMAGIFGIAIDEAADGEEGA